jgi:hypothetical protein
MANQFERKMAKIYLDSLKGKPAQSKTDDVAKSARLILDGKGSAADVQKVRQATNTFKSGAGRVRQFQRTYNNVFGSVSRIQQSVQLADLARESGKGTSVANARVIQTVSREIDGLIKTKFVRDGVKTVANAIGANPRVAANFLKTISRGLKLGGAIVGTAMIGFDVAESYFDNRKRGASATGAIRDSIKQAQIDQRYGRQIERQIRQQVLDSQSELEKVKDNLGFDGGTEEEIAKKAKERIDLVQRARSSLGSRENEVLAEVAAKKGKTVDELTDKERNEALDAETKDTLNPSVYMNDDDIEKKLQNEFHIGERVKNLGLRWNPLTRGFTTDINTKMQKRRMELAEEKAKNQIIYREKQKKDAETHAKQIRKRREEDPVENLKYRLEQQQAESDLKNYRSRHSGFNGD